MAQQLDDRESLRALDGVRVEVDALPSILTTRGLSSEGLRADVEGQLRRASLKVLPTGEFTTGDPHLRVAATVSDIVDKMIASRVEVDFVQIVFMRRNPAVTFNRARTWSANAPQSLGAVSQLADRIRGEVTRQVQMFIDDYRKVNDRL